MCTDVHVRCACGSMSVDRPTIQPNPHLFAQSVIQPKAQLRGDLAPIRVGHYCFFDEGCVLRPPSTLRDG